MSDHPCPGEVNRKRSSGRKQGKCKDKKEKQASWLVLWCTRFWDGTKIVI